MNVLNATDVRKEWSIILDNVVRQKPQFIKRTRDNILMADLDFFIKILEAYTFTADVIIEKDSSITLSLREIDIIENAENLADAKRKLSESILEYAEDFYQDFNYWSVAPNRAPHIPYVFKALALSDFDKIEEEILCQNGRS